MQLSIEMLDRAGACDEGIDFARDLLGPSGEVEIEWTPEAQGMLLGDPVARQYLGWLWHHGVVPQWSMRGANLYGADLCAANLYRADLGGADLRGADLRGAIGYTPSESA